MVERLMMFPILGFDLDPAMTRQSTMRAWPWLASAQGLQDG
jgi:hypothetical protein